MFLWTVIYEKVVLHYESETVRSYNLCVSHALIFARTERAVYLRPKGCELPVLRKYFIFEMPSVTVNLSA